VKIQILRCRPDIYALYVMWWWYQWLFSNFHSIFWFCMFCLIMVKLKSVDSSFVKWPSVFGRPTTSAVFEQNNIYGICDHCSIIAYPHFDCLWWYCMYSWVVNQIMWQYLIWITIGDLSSVKNMPSHLGRSINNFVSVQNNINGIYFHSEPSCFQPLV